MVTESKIGYTPGPWVVDSNGVGHEVVLAPRSHGSHAIAAVQGSDDPAENLANANLISVAPEMLATLHGVRAFCPVFVQDDIDALIARAEGR